MAKQTVTPPAEGASTRSGDPNPTGYLCENWLTLETPALVINPAAGRGEILAWCWGEVRALEVTARALVDSHREPARGMGAKQLSLDPEDFAVIFLHRLRPLEEVLEHVINRMDQERRQQKA